MNGKKLVISKNIIDKLSLGIILFPLFLISGPFISDFFIILLSIIFILNIKYFKIEKNIFVFLFPIMIFYLIINLSSIFSDNSVVSFKSSLPYIRFILFTIFASVLINYINFSKNKKKLFIKIFVIIFLFFLIDSVYQFIFGENIFGYEIKSHLKNQRVSSIFGEELILGSFICKMAFIFLGILHSYYKKINDFWIYAVLTISILIVFLSGERAAFVLLAIGTLMYLIFNHKIKGIIFIIPILFFVIYASFNYNPFLKTKYLKLKDTILVDKTAGLSVHIQHFNTAYKMFVNKKILGHGIKSFRLKCNDKMFNSGKESCSTHPHNYYIQILSSSGLYAFIIILGFFMLISYELIKNYILSYSKVTIDFSKNCYLISMFISLFPFTTTGSFFNNWVSSTLYFSLAFLLSEYKFIKYKYV